MPATADPFPFTKPDGYNPREFVQSALFNGPSENASKRISKIELLKDTRAMNGHWRHEFLVFRVDRGEEGLYLYFERHLFEDDETWKDMAVFAWNLFQGDALDLLTFHEPGCEEDVETKSFAKASECRGCLPPESKTSFNRKKFSKSISGRHSHSRISLRSWTVCHTKRSIQDMVCFLQIVGHGPAAFCLTSFSIPALLHRRY